MISSKIPVRLSKLRKSNNQPRGIRNNNPLNIRRNQCNRWKGAMYRYEGDDPDFEQFYETKYGFRAGFILLYNYRRLYGFDTIEKIIYHFAPPEDNNDTLAYIRTCCKYTGFAEDRVLNWGDDYIKLVYVMSFVECQQWPNIDDILLGFELANKSKFIKGGVKNVEEDSYCRT